MRIGPHRMLSSSLGTMVFWTGPGAALDPAETRRKTLDRGRKRFVHEKLPSVSLVIVSLNALYWTTVHELPSELYHMDHQMDISQTNGQNDFDQRSNDF